MTLTQTDVEFLRSLPPQELSSYLTDLAVESPAVAQSIREQVQHYASHAELCEFFAISPQTGDAWKRQGMPHVGSQGKASRYDLAKCAQWLALRRSVVNDDQGDQLSIELREEQVKLAALKRRTLEGSLVDVEKWRNEHVRVVSMIRNAVQNFHRSFGNEAMDALMKILDEVETMLTKE